MPDVDAGPVKPMVAYVSSARSGNTGKKAGLMPDAFHELLNGLLNAPPGVFTKGWLGRCRTRHSFGPWVLHVHVKAISRQTGRDGGRRLDREGVLGRCQVAGINALQQQAAARKSERSEFMLLVLTV